MQFKERERESVCVRGRWKEERDLDAKLVGLIRFSELLVIF